MKKHMKKKELESLLEHNKQEIPVGEVKCLPSVLNVVDVIETKL